MRFNLRSPVWGFLGGLVVGVLAITVWNVFGPEPTNRSDEGVIVTSADAAEDLVTAWAEMRSGTWSVRSTFERRTASGATSSDVIVEAQSPPDYIRKSAGQADARVSGRRYACSTLPDGTATACSDGGPDISYASRVNRELSDLRKTVLGPSRAYDVQSLSEGCYRLFVRPTPVVPAWGERAEFCFDRATGAPTKSEFLRSGSLDSIVAVRVRANPVPEELRLPAPAR